MKTITLFWFIALTSPILSFCFKILKVLKQKDGSKIYKFIIIFSYIQVVLLLFNILLNKINYLDKDTGFFIYKMLTLPAILSLLAFLILAFFKNNKEFIFIYLESVSFLKEVTKTLIKRKLKSFFEKDENSQFNELLGLCIAHGFYLLSKIIMFLFL